MVNIPLQGTASRPNSFNPTLLPNFDIAVASGGGTVDWQSPADFLAANPRADAAAVATIGGTVTTGDEITLVVNNPIFSNAGLGGLSPAQISHTYTTLAGDTVTTIAEALADLFNDDSNAQTVGLRADPVGATIVFRWNGPVGNSATLLVPQEAPVTVVVGGTALTNDQLNLLLVGPALSVVTNAQEIATVGGTIAAGDTAALTFTNSGVAGLPVTKTYTALVGDTPSAVAAGLATLIDADATLQAAGIYSYADNAVVTVRQMGAIGNTTVLTRTISGSGTITFGNGGNLSGGKGQTGSANVLIQTAPTTGNTTTQMATALAAAITANPVLAALAITAVGSGAKVIITVPASVEPITASAWVNTISPKATITGSVAANDVISLTVNSPAIADGSATVSYTALLGDTTSSIAAGLAAAVLANQELIAAGIQASATTNVVTFTYQPQGGQIRFASTVSPGSETVTLSTTPTETLTIGTNATETITVGSGTTALVNASVTATVTGTAVAADTVALTFTNASVKGFPVTKTYTTGADNATTIAAALVALINADAVLAAAGLTASNASGVMTIVQPGTVANSTVASRTITGTGSEAIAFTPSATMSGGAGIYSPTFSGGTGPIIPFNNFPFSRGGVIENLRAGQPVYIDGSNLAQMVNEGNAIV